MMETDKLQSTALHRFLSEDTDEVVGVLIEPDLPQHYEVISRENKDGMTISVPIRRAPETSEEQKAIEKQVAEMQAELEGLGTTPRWLASADSFLARVTPEQLRTIVRYPKVRAIYSNRDMGNRGTRSA